MRTRPVRRIPSRTPCSSNGGRGDARPRLRVALAERGGERLVDDARRRAPRRARPDEGHRPRPDAAHRGRAPRAALPRQGRREGARRAPRAPRQGARAARAAERGDPRRARRPCTRSWGGSGATACSSPRRRSRTSAAPSSSSPGSAYAIYGAREIYKSLGQWDDAIQMYEAELADRARPAAPARALARRGGDAQRRRRSRRRDAGARACARQVDEQDAALQQEFASLIVERLAAGENVPAQERTVGGGALVGLAEVYDGEHGLAYSAGALDIQPGHDRALQLSAYYAAALDRERTTSRRATSATSRPTPTGPWPATRAGCSRRATRAPAQLDNAIQILEPLRASRRRAGHREAPRALRAERAADAVRAPRRSPCPGLARRREPWPCPRRAAGPPRDRAPVRRRPAAGRARRRADARGQGQARRGLRRSTARSSRPTRRTPRRSPGSRTTCARKRDYAPLRDVLLAAVRVPGRVRRDAQGAAARGRGALRGKPPRRRRRHQRLEAAPRHRPQRRRRAAVAHAPAREDAALGRPRQPARAGGDGRGRPREEDRAREEARDPPGAEAARLRRRGRGVGAHRATSRRRTTAPSPPRRSCSRRPARIDRAAAGHRRERAPRQGRRPRAARCSSAWASCASSSTIPAAPARPTPTPPTRRRAPSSGRPRSAASSPAERWDRAGQRGRAARPHGGRRQAAGAALRARRRALRPRRATTSGVAREPRAGHRSRSDDATSTRAARASATRSAQKLGRARRSSWCTRGDRLTDKAQRVAVRRQAAHALRGAARRQGGGARDVAQGPRGRRRQGGARAPHRRRRRARGPHRGDDAPPPPRATSRSTAPRRRASRCARRSSSPRASATSTRPSPATSASSADLDPPCRPALQAIADLQEARDNPAAAADALERELEARRRRDGARPASPAASRASTSSSTTPRTPSARSRSCARPTPTTSTRSRACATSARRPSSGTSVAELLAQRIEVEARRGRGERAHEASSPAVLADKLDRGDEALAALTELADQGDPAIRDAYVELGDRLGWRGIVATKLVEWWFEAKHGAERTGAAARRVRALRRGRPRPGRRARRAARSCAARGPTRARRAARGARDQDGRSRRARGRARSPRARAHGHRPRDASSCGRPRRGSKAGAPRSRRCSTARRASPAWPRRRPSRSSRGSPPSPRSPGDVVDLYERQVSRCKAPADRVQRAGARGAGRGRARGNSIARAASSSWRSSGTPSRRDAGGARAGRARDGDRATGGERLRRALCASMASGGQGARDGGKTRGALLRRAASMAHRDLDDVEQAFAWLGDALIAHVDPLTLDALEGLAREIGDPRRAEATLTRALAEVFDGPLVRQLLARRAKLRREQLDDKTGAAADLKKLHDLSPNDQAVMDELSALLTELGDYRGDGAALRGPDPPRQGHERPRRARAQGRADVGRAAHRPARGGRRVAAGPSHEAGRRRGDRGPRARQVEHAEEAGPGARRAYAPPSCGSRRARHPSPAEPTKCPGTDPAPPPVLGAARGRTPLAASRAEPTRAG